MTQEEKAIGLGPQTVLFPIPEDQESIFRKSVEQLECEILEVDRVKNILIFKIKFSNLYALFASGVISQIDKSHDKIKDQLILESKTVSQNNKNLN